MPARRQWFVVLFLAFWLCGWFMGETSAAGEIATKGSSGTGFLIFWLGGWTLGGIWAMSLLLWFLAGREVVEVMPGSLIVRREIAGIGFSREYDLSQIRELRVSSFPHLSRSLNLRGTIAFDYGARTHRFGSGMDEAEARAIVAHLQPLFPAAA